MAHNIVMQLCVRAGLDALSCQLALMPNRSNTLEKIHDKILANSKIVCIFLP